MFNTFINVCKMGQLVKHLYYFIFINKTLLFLFKYLRIVPDDNFLVFFFLSLSFFFWKFQLSAPYGNRLHTGTYYGQDIL